MFYLIITFLSLLFTITSTPFHFEPYSLYKTRSLFISKHFPFFTSSLKYDISTSKCIIINQIHSNSTILFEFNTSSILLPNTSYYPFKSNISSFLSNDLSLPLTTTSKLTLALHILFELKNNITSTLTHLYKLNNKSELTLYRTYLHHRINNPFIINYIHNLPLSTSITYMSWSPEQLKDFQLSGTLQHNVDYIKTIYTTLYNKYNTSIFDTWLNEQNVNLFISIYHYIDTRSVLIEKEVLCLIPLLHFCNFDYESENLYNSTVNIKVTERNTIQITTNKDYLQYGNEFKFLYTNDLNNDNLISKYGIVYINNKHHSYLFNYEIYDDNKYSFYKYLLRHKYNNVKIVNDNKISIDFNINAALINKNLQTFITLYNDYEDMNIKHKQHFTIQEFNIYFTYYVTMYQNMRVIIKGMENESYETYLQEVMDFDNKIKENYKGVQQLDEKNIIEHFEHLYYYNQLYENLNKRNIHLFNLENVKVLLNQMEYTYEDIVRRQWDIITNKNFLFGKYV